MKHAGGRPTKYDPSFVDEVDKYLKNTGREQTELPTREGFAKHIGVCRDTIDTWEKATAEDKTTLLHPEFSDAIKRIDEAQKIQLMNDGLYGGKEVNSTMAIFLLKCNHGMVETNNLNLNGTLQVLFDSSLKQ